MPLLVAMMIAELVATVRPASGMRVALLVWLAARRPAVSDEEVDGALRKRTARVAFGIGFGWVGTALSLAGQRFHQFRVVGPDHPDPTWFESAMRFSGLVALVVSIVCWLWVAVPSRRSLAAPR